MSAHASLATSGCQSLSLVGESVSHQVSTPAKSTTTTTSFRQNGLTNRRTTTNVIASSAAASRFPAPNGASYHTAPNAQAIEMGAARRTSSALNHRMTRIRLRYECLGTCGERQHDRARLAEIREASHTTLRNSNRSMAKWCAPNQGAA